MSWKDQNPPVTDVLCSMQVQINGQPSFTIEVDKLDQQTYRATMGDLFQFRELTRTWQLEELLRRCNAVRGAEGYHEGLALLKKVEELK
jgi:hypothetical protein